MAAAALYLAGALLLLWSCAGVEASTPSAVKVAVDGTNDAVIIHGDSAPSAAAGRQLHQTNEELQRAADAFRATPTVSAFLQNRLRVPNTVILSPDRAGPCTFTMLNLCKQARHIKVAIGYWTTNGANVGYKGVEKKGWYTVKYNTTVTFSKFFTKDDKGFVKGPDYLVLAGLPFPNVSPKHVGCLVKRTSGAFHIFFAGYDNKAFAPTFWWSYNAASKTWIKSTGCNDKIGAYLAKPWWSGADCGKIAYGADCSP